MKKALFVLLLIQLFLLSSCTSGTPVDPETLDDILGSLVVNFDTIMVNSIYSEGNINVDQIEMLDMTNRDAVIIHIIVSSDNISENRDDMFMITSNWLYSTRNMTKTEVQIDTYDDDELFTVINNFTNLVDFDFIKREQIVNLAYSLVDPVLTHSGQRYTLRGRIQTTETLDDDVVKVCEIIYEDHTLIGLNVQYEHTFRSTMRESNYISGIHYYFNEEMIGEFPSLSAFS